MKKLLSFIIIISMMGLTVVSSSAQSVKQVSKDDKKREIESSEIYNAVTALEPYVVRLDDGTFRLDAPVKVTKKIPADILESIISSMDMTNRLISDGQLVTSSGLDVFLAGDDQLLVTKASISGGINGIRIQWYGYDVYLSHTTIVNLKYALSVGAPIAGIIAAVIPGTAFYAAIIGGVVTVYIVTIGYFDSGNGAMIKFLVTGIPFCFCSQ